MVISNLKGGLGNQMFQWAVGKNLSIKYGQKLFLDISYYIQNPSNRKFELNKFQNLNYSLTDDLKLISNLPTVVEPSSFEFLNIHVPVDGIRLDGYWQTENYFLDHKEEILKDFNISEETKNELIKRYPLVTKNSVSIHIRRTDYVTSNGFHPLQNIQYYNKALNIIRDYENILIFSDDINWCKENIKLDNSIFIENNDNVEDLHLMSMCNHNIIANSSFSWWGAFLNKNLNKKIIAPNNWFGDFTGINTTLICPKEWIKI